MKDPVVDFHACAAEVPHTEAATLILEWATRLGSGRLGPMSVANLLRAQIGSSLPTADEKAAYGLALASLTS